MIENCSVAIDFLEWCRDRKIYVATEFRPRAEGFLVATVYFMSRQSWPGQEFSVAMKYFCVTIECGQMERFCFCDIAILCHNIVGQTRKDFLS